jgi:hypothetical protein
MMANDTGACRGILGHAHEFDGLRSDAPNNFNLSTLDGAATFYLDTPAPDTLNGMSAPQWDAANGFPGFPMQSVMDQIDFTLTTDQCENPDLAVNCNCGGTVGQPEVCLAGCNET